MTKRLLGIAVLVCGFSIVGAARAEAVSQADPQLPIYKMVRTLEYVQDSIVNGDHAAMDMQRYLLTQIDARLRGAKERAFSDPQTVDAALIYAMSGGNPDTLSVLASRDVEGYFDDRLIDALSDYFAGRPADAVAALTAMEPDFRDTPIGPYLTLVTANALAESKPKAALSLFDRVRLMAPGSILEESALRRSISVAVHAQMVDRGMAYCGDYARRFLHSPYAGQFANMLVGLIVDNDDTVKRDDMLSVIAGMDADRQRELYLRISRRAAIEGKRALADDAARRATTLPGGSDPQADALAGLYGGISDLATADAEAAIARIKAIPTEDLSARDQKLRAVALSVGRAVTRLPHAESLEQASAVKLSSTHDDTPPDYPQTMQPIPNRPAKPEPVGIDQKELSGFVSAQRDRLKAIDALLEKNAR